MAVISATAHDLLRPI